MYVGHLQLMCTFLRRATKCTPESKNGVERLSFAEAVESSYRTRKR